MPPSAINGMRSCSASATMSTAVICGTPTPATTRVVQIEPGPTPTLTASAPASINASAASPVTMLPPITQLRISLLDPRHAIDHALRMTMRSIDDNHVHASCGKQFDTLFGIAAHTHRRAHQQALGAVLGGIRVVGLLLDVLDRDQAAQLEAVVDHQDLFDAIAMQQLEHFLIAGAFAHGDQAILLGRCGGPDRRASFEAHVAAGDDTDQFTAVDHRHAGDVARARRASTSPMVVSGRTVNGSVITPIRT